MSMLNPGSAFRRSNWPRVDDMRGKILFVVINTFTPQYLAQFPGLKVRDHGVSEQLLPAPTAAGPARQRARAARPHLWRGASVAISWRLQ